MRVMKKIQNSLLVFILVLTSVLMPTAAFAEDDEVYYVSAAGNDTNDGSMSTPFQTISKAISSVTGTTGRIVLQSDITLNEKLTISASGKNITITSATSANDEKHSIIRDESYVDDNLLYLTGGTIMFENLIIDGNDVLTDSEANGVYVYGASVSFTNVEIKNHNIEGEGTSVIFAYGSSSSATLKQDTFIHQNTVRGRYDNNPPSVLAAGSGGRMIIEDGLVTENTVDADSNGVIVGIGLANSPSFQMTGGQITRNHLLGVELNSDGAMIGNVAVNMRGTSDQAKFYFGGTAYVYDNLNSSGEQRNVYLKNTTATGSAYLSLIEAMAAGAKVGVYANIMPDADNNPIVDVAIGADDYTASVTDAVYFVSDKDTNAAIGFDGTSNKVVLKYQDPIVVEVEDDGDLTTYPEGGTVKFETYGTPTGNLDDATVTISLVSLRNGYEEVSRSVPIDVYADGSWSLSDWDVPRLADLPPGDYRWEIRAGLNGVSNTKLIPFSVIVDKQPLRDLVESSKSLQESDYTGESWAVFAAKRDTAEGMLTNPDSTQAEIDAALTDLEAAYEGLVPEGKLSSLSLMDSNGEEVVLSPAFDPTKAGNYNATATVDNSVSKISVNPTLAEAGTKQKLILNGVEITNPADWDSLELNVGENTIVVKVYDEKTNAELSSYTIVITRSAPSGSGGGGGSVTPEQPEEQPAIEVTVDNEDDTFATGRTSDSDGRMITEVQVDPDKLKEALSEGNGQELVIHSPNEGDMVVDGLTDAHVQTLADTNASLTISNHLAIYPVPSGELNVSGIAAQLGNAAPGDIDVHIEIARASESLIASAENKAAAEGYELLVTPVTLDMTFTHEGKTIRADQLTGYAPRYIALPDGIDLNRITTGVIIDPDGSVYHVPTVVTEIDNRYYATIHDLRGDGTYSVIWNPQDFEDVRGHWGQKDINNIAARLDLKGNGDNTFSPDRDITRSEFAEIVVIGLGLRGIDAPGNEYPDVPETAWYKESVAIASKFGIVKGYDNGLFKGNQEITREQGMAIIARAYRLIAPQSTLSEEKTNTLLAGYRDASDLAAWAREDAALLIQAGIVQGQGQQLLNPQANITRAEVAALVARLLKTTDLIDR